MSRSSNTSFAMQPHPFVATGRRVVFILDCLSTFTLALIASLLSQTGTDLSTNLRVYRQVLAGFATLQTGIQDLTSAYIKHANTVLGPGAPALGSTNPMLANAGNPLANIAGNGLVVQQDGPTATTPTAANDAAKKKRKKPDPNAPKRVLTAYFRFLKQARGVVKEDMPEGTSAKAVQEECAKRWNEMPEVEKKVRAD